LTEITETFPVFRQPIRIIGRQATAKGTADEKTRSHHRGSGIRRTGHRVGNAMRCALVNPNWTFDGSVYFGCREPHLPIELGYAGALLEREGHETLLVDGHMEGLSREETASRVAAFAPDMTVLTTAPSYLFWRCAPPELRVPMITAADLANKGGTLVVVGPHPSVTPAAALKKTGADVAVLGECEEILPRLIGSERESWGNIPSLAWLEDGELSRSGIFHESDLSLLPPLRWKESFIRRHGHHHHRFDTAVSGAAAEVEFSRGCPFDCTFCTKESFRNRYRKRPLPVVLEEIDGLAAQGVRYFYFIDELFLPETSLLTALACRDVKIGIQTRIDLWNRTQLDLLGEAGCVSLEACVETVSEEGRRAMDKPCRITTDEIVELLLYAGRRIPFVQANLVDPRWDPPEAVNAWRRRLLPRGVWANIPVPVFPYPGSAGYRRLWGQPDDAAWERAHEHYLSTFGKFSDIREQDALPLPVLEACR
jgi:anaerobic magnesium-protoporphyrin IX monomethyl ester cyclase